MRKVARARCSVVWLGLAAACHAPPAGAHTATAAQPPGVFDDSLVAPEPKRGCVYNREALSDDARLSSSYTLAALKAELLRSWNAQLTWDEASGFAGGTRLHLAIRELQGAAQETPVPSPRNAESVCERYVRLEVVLHLHTDDGRWEAAGPATLRVDTTGARLLSSSRPLSDAGLARGGSQLARPSDEVSLFSELTSDGAAGELRVQHADGSREVVATWH